MGTNMGEVQPPSSMHKHPTFLFILSPEQMKTRAFKGFFLPDFFISDQ